MVVVDCLICISTYTDRCLLLVTAFELSCNIQQHLHVLSASCVPF